MTMFVGIEIHATSFALEMSYIMSVVFHDQTKINNMSRLILSFILLLHLSTSAVSQSIDLIPYVTGLSSAVDIVHAGTNDLYVAENAGYVRLVDETGTLVATPFLDITDRVVNNANERGLLGIAFHPQYPDSAYIYCNYTGTGGGTVISRFDVTSPTGAEAMTEKIILTYSQPANNHNGGDLEFDDEGYLLIASGDGGGSGDPGDNGQDLTTLLGKILRIDVDTSGPYRIPPGNPYAGVSAVREEIYAYGLRNPWRIDYDEMTSTLYIADVGQNDYEEVSLLPDGTTDPNFGWRCYEGYHPYNLTDCAGIDTIAPIYEYPHNTGVGCTASITGGKLYRGNDMQGYQGRYFYADFCNGWIGTLDTENNFSQDTVYPPSSLRFMTFGEGVDGELYVAATNGTIYKLQGVIQNSFVFTINLDGAQSGTGSPATGYGIGVYDTTANVLRVSGQFTELNGDVTVAHVHDAPSGSNGPVVFGLNITDYGTDSIGFFGAGSLTPGEEMDLLTEGLYVNIHSSTNTGGEIRGQIILTDCPNAYQAVAPLLPTGTYPVQSTEVNGRLSNSRNMSIEYENSTDLLPGFELLLGSTLEVLQDDCP